MNEIQTTNTVEESALEIIRSETALSRFPMHRIAKKGEISIEFKGVSSALYWNVSHNSKYGQPGPLAYKIDTLLINRRIEKVGKPVPKYIKLGSLPEIAAELGNTAGNWNSLKQALLQNASAFITAKLSYRTAEGGEKSLEAGFFRYQVLFTGETMPDGRSADAVYIILGDVYHEILNNAVFRPLDYEYMKELPPSAQRFYEIISYQIYAALKHKNPRAKLLYSEYCLLSTATRYFDFDHVKKQIYKVVRPHMTSGYLAKVEYEAMTNDQGQADWMMYFTPGFNAGRQYRAFTGHRVPKIKPGESPATEVFSLPFNNPSTEAKAIPREKTADVEAPHSTENEQDQDLIEELVRAQLNRTDAIRLAREKPDVCRRQLDYLPFIEKFKTSRGAYLRSAIEGDFGPPPTYSQAQERQEQEQASKRRRAQELFAANEKKARQSHQERFYGAYLAYLRERVGELEKAQPAAFMAFREGETAQRAVLTEGPFAKRPLNQKAVEVFDREETRLERCLEYFREHGTEVLTFWEWDEALNSGTFKP